MPGFRPRSGGPVPALLAVLTLLGAFGATSPLRADGWIYVDRPITIHRPRPPRPPHWYPPRPPRHAWGGLEVTRHWVSAEIDRGIAHVKIDETFRSPHPVQVEGTYYFPLPPNSHIDDFRAVLNGKELAGEILPKDKARRIYEGLVRKVRDPALLEYYQRDLFRARIFPIPANGDVKVKISYRQTLRLDGGFTRFRYPLDTGRFAAGPYKDVKIAVDLITDQPIRSVTSPSHAIDVKKRAATKAHISFEAATLPAQKDFLLDYLTARDGLAGGVRTFRESGEDGYFMLRVAPGDDIPDNLPPVSLVLICDTSGSMSGRKIEHARKALLASLERLRPIDSFQILTFSSTVRSFAEQALPATPDNISAARGFVSGLTARGGTDINSALDRALARAGTIDGAPTLLLLSDGAPTVGETNPKAIVANAKKLNGGDYRIHIFGVGADVNTLLLDDLSRQNGGSRTYLTGADGLELALSGLIDKVTVPCLNDLRVSVEGNRNVRIQRLEPEGPYDLFFGEDLVIAGRYTGSGEARIRIDGDAGGVHRAFVFPANFRSHGGEEEAAYLWAQMRIYRLLDVLRGAPHNERGGLEKEIVDLGLRFGIVTPYTSFLVQEDDSALSSHLRGRIRSSRRLAAETLKESSGFYQRSKRDEFDYSKKQADQRAAEKKLGTIAGLKAGAPGSEIEREVQILHRGGRAFIPVDGLHVDGAFQGKELPQADKVLLFGTDDHLEFLRANPGAAQLMSGSRSVLFKWRNEIVRVDYDPAKVPDAEIPPVKPAEKKPEPKKKVEWF